MSNPVSIIKRALNSVLENLFFPKTKPSKILSYLFGTIIILTIAATITLNEITKQDINKSQLEIEKNRITVIDKQLNSLYNELYFGKQDSISKPNYGKEFYLNQIEFLKKQRDEAIKNIDSINQKPYNIISAFAILISVLTVFLLAFFTNSFSSSLYSSKQKNERGEFSKKGIKNNSSEFLEWVISEEVTDFEDDSFDIEKARKYKDIYDLTETLGESRKKLLKHISEVVELTKEKELSGESVKSDVKVLFDDIQYRLKGECIRLNKQALINLFLCFFIILILITFVSYNNLFVTDNRVFSSFSEFLMNYVPKVVSILSLLTVFFYFIRLYKTNILDVKYYQNELTNIELKQMAIELAIAKDDKETIDHLIKEAIKTERNQVFGKDQTTIDIERQKLENEINKNYLDKTWEMMASLFDLKKDK